MYRFRKRQNSIVYLPDTFPGVRVSLLYNLSQTEHMVRLFFLLKEKGSNVHICCQDRNCCSNLRQRWMRSNLPGFSAKQLKQEIKKLRDKTGEKDWGVGPCA